MAVKTFTTNELLTSSDTNTYLANSGLVYITTLSATNAAAAFVDSVFNGTYRNYVIVADFYCSTSTAVLFRMRAAGSDYTSSAYYDRGVQNTAGTVNALANNAQTASFFGAATANDYAHAEMTMFHPYVGTRTSWNLASHDAWNVQYYNNMGIVATSAPAFDGIKFYASSGNISGDFRFYGIRNI